MISKQRAEEIAEAYYNLVYRFSLSKVGYNEDVASDITQDVFLLFQEKCPQLDDIGIYTWLSTVACNKCHEYFRRVQREQRFVPLDEYSATVDYEEFFDLLDSCFPANDEDLAKYINVLLKSLTAKERELYQKLYVERKSQKQTAEELGISESAVSSGAYRLRKKLKAVIHFMTTALGQFIVKTFF